MSIKQLFIDNKTYIRDQYFEMIGKKDIEYEDYFRSLPPGEKKKLLLIFFDNYINILHEEIVQKKFILSKDEFWNYIKRRLAYKINFLTCNQPIQLSSKNNFI
jgi:hypothetical protein